jgi:hypothetical protein
LLKEISASHVPEGPPPSFTGKRAISASNHVANRWFSPAAANLGFGLKKIPHYA